MRLVGEVAEYGIAPRRREARRLRDAEQRGRVEIEQDDSLESAACVYRIGGTQPVLTLDHISKRYAIDRRYEAVALEDVSLFIPASSVVAVVGESGSGKSTLLNVAMRLIKPDKGRVIYDRSDITELSSRKLVPFRKHAQYIPQDPFASLNPRRSVFHSVALGLAVQQKSGRKELEDQVGDLLELVGLRRDWMYRYPHEFSGGERQRVCIARALATKPRVVVADEPTAALDLTLRNAILDLLADVRHSRGVAILLATHDFGVVNAIASMVAVMYKGMLVEIGAKDAVLNNPQHPYTKTLIGAVLSGDPKRKHRGQESGVEVGTRLVSRGSRIRPPKYDDVGDCGNHFVMKD